jgi:hypothetical protein
MVLLHLNLEHVAYAAGVVFFGICWIFWAGCWVA